MKHFEIPLALQRDTTAFALDKFETNLKMYIQVVRYLSEARTSQRSPESSNGELFAA